MDLFLSFSLFLEYKTLEVVSYLLVNVILLLSSVILVLDLVSPPRPDRLSPSRYVLAQSQVVYYRLGDSAIFTYKAL